MRRPLIRNFRVASRFVQCRQSVGQYFTDLFQPHDARLLLRHNIIEITKRLVLVRQAGFYFD